MNRNVLIAGVAVVLLAGIGFFLLRPADEAMPEPQAVIDEVEDTVEEATAAVEATATDVAEKVELVEESSGDEVEEETDKPLILAQADTPAANREWKFKEGTHFYRMVPTQPTVGGSDKVEVAEIFWYGCNHCYDFEAFVERWLESKPANVRFERIHAVWNPLVRLHAQLYYTEEVLAKNGKLADRQQFRNAVFAEYHRRGNRLASVDAIQAVFEKHGVSAEDFTSTWNSFEVAQKISVAQDLGRRYGISSVPAVVVNGKYRTGAGEAGGYPKLLELIDELVERESIR